MTVAFFPSLEHPPLEHDERQKKTTAAQAPIVQKNYAQIIKRPANHQRYSL